MTSYMQVGHTSDNLVQDPQLNGYRGLILSPVNYEHPKMQRLVQRAFGAGYRDIIFDPQLYFPRTERRKLTDWSYFPSDVDTADRTAMSWWDNVCQKLVPAATSVGTNSVATPADVPRKYTLDYYDFMIRVGRLTEKYAAESNLKVYQTILTDFNSFSDSSSVMTLASIITGNDLRRVLLIFTSDVYPRREFTDTDSIEGAMRLINLLEGAGVECVVSCCSSDVLLWKAAGASHCSTGKFWNLRRFSPSRWGESDRREGQMAYWFEESLMAFLREADVLRVRREGLLSQSSLQNPYSNQILELLDRGEGDAWVGLGWRQFLWWASSFQQRCDAGIVDFDSLLKTAEQNWEKIEDSNILMEETRNDGRWLRPWRQAVRKF